MLQFLETESEMIFKYKDPKTEIQCTWNMKAKVIPVLMGATGSISESHR